MAISKRATKTQRKILEQWFPALAASAADERNAARLETLEILMDVDQVSSLFSSLDDVRQGRMLGMNDAFGDL